MNLQHCLAAFLLLIVKHIDKVFTQSAPISPCPRIFQYHFDGNEWYGLISVWKYQLIQIIQVKVTLSLRGKPATDYLGEIELLTRGRFSTDVPLVYKVKFPKSNFLPKLMEISVNDHIICYGYPDQSILTTELTLEHTVKLKFIPYSQPASPAPPTTTQSTPSKLNSEEMVADAPAKDVTEASVVNIKQPTFQFPVNTDKDTFHFTLKKCGQIDSRMRHQFLDAFLPENHGAVPSHSHDITIDIRNSRPSTLSPTIRSGDLDTLSSGEKQNASHETRPIFVNSSPIFSSDGKEDLPSITRGAWPWLAAIYVNNLTSLKYQCAGTLISNQIVISAAHCFQLFKQSYTANEVLVFLGRHNLKNWNEEQSIASPVDDIYIHPDYNIHLNSHDADIAILVLKNEIKFNTYIGPACLWSGSTELEYTIGEMGVVVGWNLSNNNRYSRKPLTIPKIMLTPVVSNEDCYKANIWYKSLSSNRTFCAGRLYKHRHLKHNSQINSTFGPCTGASGAGLLLYKSQRWMLRGIVSGSILKFNFQDNDYMSDTKTVFHKYDLRKQRRRRLASKDSYINCNVGKYVIYTDVAQFLDWIYAFII